MVLYLVMGSGCHEAVLSLAPKFESCQKIAQKITQNFCAIFKTGQKSFRMLPKFSKSSQKLHKMSTNWLKATNKLPLFFFNSTELFHFCQKYPKKLQKSSYILERFRSGDSSAMMMVGVVKLL